MGFSLSAQASLINYDNFNDTSSLQLNGNTTTVTCTDGDILRLSSSSGGNGSVYTQDKMSLDNNVSFSTKFTFNINNQVGGGADGLMFILQTQNNTLFDVGGGMGFDGLSNSFGIEFDTWDNGAGDGYSYSHIGINLNGNVNSVVHYDTLSDFGDFDNPSIDWTAWVEYDGTTGLLQIFFSNDVLKPVTHVINYTVDLAGTLQSSEAYIGFSSATGAAAANNNLKSWELYDSYTVIDAEPVPLGQLLAY